jgi:hypothetical protein
MQNELLSNATEFGGASIGREVMLQYCILSFRSRDEDNDLNRRERISELSLILLRFKLRRSRRDWSEEKKRLHCDDDN